MSSSSLAGGWEARRAGVVIAAGDVLEIELDPDAPRNQALSASGLMPFPRVGGYVLVPTDIGATVGLIQSVRIDRAHPAGGDQEVVPRTRRVLVADPVAEIRRTAGEPSVEPGIEAFPSIGDPAIVPTLEDLRLVMVGVGEDQDAGRIRLGSAEAASSIEVDLSIDALFGRHVAVVGTTGSGKSSTLATLIRRTVLATDEASETPTPRFLVLDPNGEYAGALRDLPGFRHVVAEPLEGAAQLTIPAWLWTVEEWATLLRASPGVQLPVLRTCLSTLRWGSAEAVDPLDLRSLLERLRDLVDREKHRVHDLDNTTTKSLGQQLKTLVQDLRAGAETAEAEIDDLLDQVQELEQSQRERGGWYSRFSASQLEDLVEPITDALEQLASLDNNGLRPLDTSAPIAFDVRSLAGALRQEAVARGERDNVEPLAMRVEALLQDDVSGRVLAPTDGPNHVSGWLQELMGPDGDASVAVLDLSLMPSELMHVVSAVLARFVFEAHHRHVREEGIPAPSVLVLDEAHRFVQPRAADEEPLSAAERCRVAFTRIAQEGRKFGLGLVLASQRPSQISTGILAQCGTLIVHRLGNERDQQVVTTALGQGSGVARQLSSLPTGSALLGGWAVRSPQLVRVDHLPEAHRPRSDDPPYWAEWTATPPRDAYSKVAARWLGRRASGDSDEAGGLSADGDGQAT